MPGADDPYRAAYVAIGAQIAAARLAEGLTQEQLADRTGLHTVMVSRVERGRTNARLSTLLRIASGLGVDLGELVGGVTVPSERG
ncbi:MAG TPA: helix-turn-helix transcriptional regulator [Baekduia sp.]